MDHSEYWIVASLTDTQSPLSFQHQSAKAATGVSSAPSPQKYELVETAEPILTQFNTPLQTRDDDDCQTPQIDVRRENCPPREDTREENLMRQLQTVTAARERERLAFQVERYRIHKEHTAQMQHLREETRRIHRDTAAEITPDIVFESRSGSDQRIAYSFLEEQNNRHRAVIERLRSELAQHRAESVSRNEH